MTEKNNNLSKVFEGANVQIIVDENNEPLFELYSTGAALGYITAAKGKNYPHKTRIEKTVENAEISTVVHGVQQYLTESQLYDFMFEAHTDKCKPFRKWVTNEVLPTIRKTGCYITESAVEESIDYQSKYGIRRIRKTFNESTDPRKTYEEYIELSKVESKAKRINNKDRIKASKIIIDTLQDKIANEVQLMRPSELLGIQELVVDIQDDIIKLNNKRNGGLRSSITKKMNELEDKYTELYEDFNMEDANYYEIPVHPFSNNYQYTYNVNTHKPVKTDVYVKWIDKLHLDQCLPTEYPNLDTNKPIKISLGYICKPNFDTSNFSKSIIDEISKYYNFNDSLITEVRAKRIDTCQEYYDGRIYIKLENVDDID